MNPYRKEYNVKLSEHEDAQYKEGWAMFNSGGTRPIGRSRRAGWDAASAVQWSATSKTCPYCMSAISSWQLECDACFHRLNADRKKPSTEQVKMSKTRLLELI